MAFGSELLPDATASSMIRPSCRVICRSARSATSVGARNAGVNKRKFDIFQRGCPRQKGRQLEYEADVLAPDGRACVLAQLCSFSPLERKLAVLDRERHV